MVRVISQETFDSIVKENEEDLGMKHEDAIEEAILELQAQGVSLLNIVTTGSKDDSSSDHSVVKTIKCLDAMLGNANSVDLEVLQKNLKDLKTECDIDLAHKVLAGKNKAYDILLKVLELFQDNHDVAHITLCTLTSLMAGQPDLLDEQGVKIVKSYLKKENDVIVQQTLRWARQCCFKHESNRQMIMNGEICIHLQDILISTKEPMLIRNVCMVMRALVLDDDIRVPYGNAHVHARTIACDYGGIKTITNLLKFYKNDKDTVNELLQTLGSLVVRDEFCREVDENGGLGVLMDVMVNHPDDEKINRQALKLLKGLAGSDQVKVKIVQAGAIPVLISAISRHQSSVALFTSGCLAVAAVALRSPANSQALCDSGAAEAVVQGMKEHAADVNAQKAASLAVRNIVSRKKELSQEFLDLNIEELLHDNMKTHGEQYESNAKDALRDLGCAVHLKERWTGKGSGISGNE